MNKITEITIPYDHPCTVCGSKTLLNVFPSQYAGLWECTDTTCGACDSCEHANTHTEPTEETVWYGDVDMSHEADITVCDLCGKDLEDF